ncbi:hypothetical protein AVEN_202110-1 [Araneus ventricosus]|uniref:Uncharacterized protein n=1 Tax=Araneus ventricosus TaxID=182803 RepID=A0A4Y2UD27_ARAVE|nr:hypothetical protein AVEN_202110-1 [Araneus ventricosus]
MKERKITTPQEFDLKKLLNDWAAEKKWKKSQMSRSHQPRAGENAAQVCYFKRRKGCFFLWMLFSRCAVCEIRSLGRQNSLQFQSVSLLILDRFSVLLLRFYYSAAVMDEPPLRVNNSSFLSEGNKLIPFKLQWEYRKVYATNA